VTPAVGKLADAAAEEAGIEFSSAVTKTKRSERLGLRPDALSGERPDRTP
jgi:hypothetical protein